MQWRPLNSLAMGSDGWQRGETVLILYNSHAIWAVHYFVPLHGTIALWLNSVWNRYIKQILTALIRAIVKIYHSVKFWLFHFTRLRLVKWKSKNLTSWYIFHYCTLLLLVITTYNCVTLFSHVTPLITRNSVNKCNTLTLAHHF